MTRAGAEDMVELAEAARDVLFAWRGLRCQEGRGPWTGAEEVATVAAEATGAVEEVKSLLDAVAAARVGSSNEAAWSKVQVASSMCGVARRFARALARRAGPARAELPAGVVGVVQAMRTFGEASAAVRETGAAGADAERRELLSLVGMAAEGVGGVLGDAVQRGVWDSDVDRSAVGLAAGSLGNAAQVLVMVSRASEWVDL